MAETVLSADASSNGLGAVLLQKFEAEWRPVIFASRSMSETETRYAQIEKEALAITWACDKFSVYILGKQFTVETDHKPLVPLLSSKQLLPSTKDLEIQTTLDEIPFCYQARAREAHVHS